MPVKNSINRSHFGYGLFLITLVLGWFALPPAAQALLPAPSPDGGYPNANTAEGDGALFSLTAGTIGNTVIGAKALNSNTTGTDNTATGSVALQNNQTGNYNTATGVFALQQNNADDNTATGAFALEVNTTGGQNTANGSHALYQNDTGPNNPASGFHAHCGK